MLPRCQPLPVQSAGTAVRATIREAFPGAAQHTDFVYPLSSTALVLLLPCSSCCQQCAYTLRICTGWSDAQRSLEQERQLWLSAPDTVSSRLLIQLPTRQSLALPTTCRPVRTSLMRLRVHSLIRLQGRGWRAQSFQLCVTLFVTLPSLNIGLMTPTAFQPAVDSRLIHVLQQRAIHWRG
jgi:hypothetical protein